MFIEHNQPSVLNRNNDYIEHNLYIIIFNLEFFLLVQSFRRNMSAPMLIKACAKACIGAFNNNVVIQNKTKRAIF